MNSQGYSNGSSVGTGNVCTKFSITGTILREIAHVRKRYDNPGESTIWRAPASRAVGSSLSCQCLRFIPNTEALLVDLHYPVRFGSILTNMKP